MNTVLESNGYIRVAAATNKIVVADPEANAREIIRIAKSVDKNIKILVFPELCITGYTCGDLFHQSILIDGARKALLLIANELEELDCMVCVGLPFKLDGKLYNVMAFIKDGNILAMVPKKNIPNYSEFYEMRYFTPGPEEVEVISVEGQMVPFGQNILLQCANLPSLTIAGEICEDLWVPNPPSTRHAMNGATLIVNASASDEVVGKADYRRSLVSCQSARTVSAYVYASAGEGESTQDLIFSGHNVIAENGTILAESKRFFNQLIVADIDIEKLIMERMRLSTYTVENDHYYRVVYSYNESCVSNLMRKIDRCPFVPKDERERGKRCDEILTMQSLGLKKRMEHIGCKKVVIGVSGGLDSTLALLVAIKAFDMMGLSRKNILGVTMPCFGTTKRTRDNALDLMNNLKITVKNIPLDNTVTSHLFDIDYSVKDRGFGIAYENAQARERTQVLMDIANMENAIVIGTGDMSELALGWCTYNGDHMSMYAVNVGVPKTLVKYLVRYYTDTEAEAEAAAVLNDILDTPISPELLPSKNGEIEQKTEDKIGPYELHDFFLYNVLRFGYRPTKVFMMASVAFDGIYSNEEIKKWMKVFYKRFFSQQFKRSCLPDGPKVGSIALSPRGDLRMPSDACARLWLEEIEKI